MNKIVEKRLVKRLNTRWQGGILWFILAVSLATHLLCLVAGRIWLASWSWPHEPFHTTVELVGGMIALGVAWMLLSLERLDAGTSFNIWIAAALVGMGILDSLHAMVHVGQAFVWLHSTATFVGGLLFTMVWLPANWQRRAKSWPWAVLFGALLFGILSLIWRDSLPQMVDNGRFTLVAKALNLLGGVLLFFAAIRLVLTYRWTRNVDDLLFCLHCGLFGAAAIMFEQSTLWDVPWWGWHLLRLLAYGVALWFVFETDLRTAQKLREQAATGARLAALEESAEALERSNQQLRQEQYLLNTLVNNIPDPVFFKDRQGRFLRVNQAMANDAGFRDPTELLGKTDAEVWAGELAAETAKDERRIIETGEPLINKEEMPMVEGGQQRWVLVTKMALKGDAGEITGVFGVARDITALKQQELERQRNTEALAKAKTALERSNADLQQFAYVASHDLQEPLRAVAGYCQLLEARLSGDPDEEIQLFLRHATDGAKRMQSLISNLLDYARVETQGKEFKVVDLHDAVRGAIANLKVAIEECDAKISFGDLPSIRGDRSQLVQLYQNLIGNAIKFRTAAAPRVRIDAVRESGQWRISVADNGIGIEQEYAKKIFVIFQRLHTRDKYPGTGLGLAITKRIVERHGGKIWVESQPNSGSIFCFTFPVDDLASVACN